MSKELIERLKRHGFLCNYDHSEVIDALEAMSAVVEAARAAYNQMDMTPELYDLEDALTALDGEGK